MNALQREAAARREAMDAARANGRGGGAAKEAFLDANATDPFIAHQLAKLGVDEEKYQEAMRAAAEERAAALSAAKEHGRGGQLVGVMDGYGGEESFKGRRMGDFYDEDYGEYYPQAPAAGAPLPAPAEKAPAPARASRRPGRNRSRWTTITRCRTTARPRWSSPRRSATRSTSRRASGAGARPIS